MTSDQMLGVADQIVDQWTSHLGSDEQIGSERYLLKRSDLSHLVLATLEIAIRRASRAVTENYDLKEKSV